MKTRALGAGAILALLILPPAAQAAKPKPTKTEILKFSANEGSKSKRIYTGKFFTIKGDCESEGRPQIVFTATVDGVDAEQVHVGVPSDSYARSAQGLQKGQKSAVTLPAATGQVIVQGPKASQLVTMSDIYNPGGFDRDCDYRAALTTVGKKDVISASTDSSKDLKADGPLDLELNCGESDGTIDLSTLAPAGLLGVDHLTVDGLRQELVPLSPGATLFGPATDLGSALFVDAAEESTGYRMRVKPPPFPGDPCGASGLASTPKQEIYYEAGGPAPRSRIHGESGLTLSASCSLDQVDVFASTTKPGSLLTVTSISEDDEFAEFVDPFSNTEADPLTAVSVQNDTQSGQLNYVRPDGKMVAIDYLARNQGSSCLVGATSWTAKR